MGALRRSSRISRKDRIINVTIRRQIGLEETIIKEIEQKQLTWYGHVQESVRLQEDTLMSTLQFGINFFVGYT